MQCKNCERSLRTDYGYCPDCGAKVIRNRITVKNLWFDIIDRYFNLDNTFLKTFAHLFTKPQLVIEGYIQGIRRKYLNPISYLGIALTLSSFTLFLMKKAGDVMDLDVFNTGRIKMEAQQKVFDFTFEYNSVFFVLYIPMMAMAAWLSFQKKGYNFSERIVIFLYTLAQYSLAIFIPSVLLLWTSPENYMTYSYVSLAFMYVYVIYVIKKIAAEKGLEFWSKTLLFSTIFTIMFFGLSLGFLILLLLTGEVTLADFAPQKT